MFHLKKYKFNFFYFLYAWDVNLKKKSNLKIQDQYLLFYALSLPNFQYNASIKSLNMFQYISNLKKKYNTLFSNLIQNKENNLLILYINNFCFELLSWIMLTATEFMFMALSQLYDKSSYCLLLRD